MQPDQNSHSSENTSAVELEFSNKYDQTHSEKYLRKHQDGLSRKLSHKRDCQLARWALRIAGNPDVVLDLPCGAGRFWPILAERPGRIIYAADNSADMLQVAMSAQPKAVAQRVKAFQTSAFAIDLEDDTVDSIFSIRLLHHIADSEHRLAMLKEFHRVARHSVIVSLWVDGNYKSWRRKRLEKSRAKKRGEKANQNRFVVNTTQIEKEFNQAGFTIIGKKDFLPRYSMWRVYVLAVVNS